MAKAFRSSLKLAHGEYNWRGDAGTVTDSGHPDALLPSLDPRMFVTTSEMTQMGKNPDAQEVSHMNI